MVKNLPTVERSTIIRFGKHCTENQADNSIVFNASDEPIVTEFPNSVYMTPLRTRQDLTDRSITILAYNQVTKEVMDSTAVAEDILNFSLDAAVQNGNVTTRTVSFNDNVTSFTTLSNAGVSNGAPIHTLDVGSKFYVDDVGSNVLTVLGNTYLQNNLIVNGKMDVRGTLTTIDSVNTTIKDAIIEIGKGSSSIDDMGLIMDRSGTSVVIGYQENVDEFIIAYTDSSATSSIIVPSSELIDARVHGRLHTNSNLSVNTDTLHVDATTDRVGINTLTPSTDFHVEGETYVSGNVTIQTDLNVTGNAYVSSNAVVTGNVDVQTDLNVIGNGYMHTDLTVTGNAYMSSNIVVTGNTDVQTDLNVIGIGYMHTDLIVTGNAYMSSNVVVTGNADVQTDLNVTGNAYVSSNAVVTGNVDVQTDLNVLGNGYMHTDLTVTGSAYMSSDIVVTENAYMYSDLVVTGNAYITSNTVVTGPVSGPTGNVDVHSHLNVTGNAYVSSNIIVDGGLITNRSGLTRKTYGYSGGVGVVTASTTPEINVVFNSQLFSAKIIAHLVEPTSNISVLNLDVTGGTGRNIGKGFLSIVGDQNSKHWDSVITTTDTTVTLRPSTGLLSDGTYGISVEYTSPLGTGGVTSIDKDNVNQITFSY
jgi:predicted acyltransferase (DUF342 family)